MGCSTCPAKAILNIVDTQTVDDSSCGKLNTFDWLGDIPDGEDKARLVEVRFKNTHKDFFLNEKGIDIKRGDYIAVAADRGHDIGQVSLTGRMASLQIKRKNPRQLPTKTIYRKATTADIEKWHKARLLEKPTLIKARQIADSLKLNMKISDVEYQGDGSKAIFYYIADGRIDFRELIKQYAKQFTIRIDMRQIGARQEAAMVGGIGSCGKELCCSSWRTNLLSVSSNAAKIQELPHNIQKLTGQCGKLKCCLMYELDTYLEAQEEFPDILLELELDRGIAYPQKKDLLKRVIYYSHGEKNNTKITPVHLDRVKEIIQLNKRGIKPEFIVDEIEPLSKELSFTAPLSELPKKEVHSKVKKKSSGNRRFKKRKNNSQNKPGAK